MSITGEYSGLNVRVDGAGVAWFEFNRPDQLNAMTSGMRRDLIELLTLAELDDTVRVVVLTAQGRGFCAGMDVRSTDDDAPALVSRIPDAVKKPANLYGRLRLYSQEVCLAIRKLDKLTIAAVNGYAIQIGLSMVLACDFAIAAKSSKLGSATVRMGYQPDEGGHWLLVEHLGVKRALDFMVHNRIVGGDEAASLGLVNEVVEDSDLMSRTNELAQELARGPQTTLRLLKRAVYGATRLTLEQAGEDIALRTAINDFQPDADEGLRAWLERRPAEFE